VYQVDADCRRLALRGEGIAEDSFRGFFQDSPRETTFGWPEVHVQRTCGAKLLKEASEQRGIRFQILDRFHIIEKSSTRRSTRSRHKNEAVGPAAWDEPVFEELTLVPVEASREFLTDKQTVKAERVSNITFASVTLVLNARRFPTFLG